MPSIAEFVLPTDEFPLGRVFETYPEATLELDRVVPFEDTVMPFFWVRAPDGDVDGVRDVLAGLSELRSVTLLDVVEDRGLFQAEWVPEYMGIMRAIGETGVTVVSASGSDEGWMFEIRASSAEGLASFQQYCAEHDIGVVLRRLHRLSETAGAGKSLTAYGVTDAQREALVLAYERGYYESPSRVSLAELGEELGITGQSVGSRLRRGTAELVANTLREST